MDNYSMISELSEWKGRALFLDQAVKRLVIENRELRHELGRSKSQVMQWQKNCEEARRQRDREVNRKRTIQHFEEEERRAHAIALASFNEPIPLTADEHGHAKLMKRIPPTPMRRVIVSVTQSHQQQAANFACNTTSTSAMTAQRIQQQQQGRSFPTALSVFGQEVSTPNHSCRRAEAVPSKNISRVSVRFTQSNSVPTLRR